MAIRVGITLGDPHGIGPEVVLKALALWAPSDDVELVWFADPLLVKGQAEVLGLPVPSVPFVWPLPPVDWAFGHGTSTSGQAAIDSLNLALDAWRAGQIDAVVTPPLSKEHVPLPAFTGHTSYLAHAAGGEALMLLRGSELTVALATEHVALADVRGALSTDLVLRKLRALDAALRRDYVVSHPRLALLALNPHAGDGGRIGSDEQTWLLEAVDAARREGLDVRGPLAADGFFAWRGYCDVDATLALYHDQGLIPFKMLAVHDGVNATAGLDLVRTSPDHGTAWDLAGQGRADAGSMLAALHTAVEVVKNRRATR
ncbi:MAG: 4-hydroxythreonine-4-phosphate dehydrogenase PdxA [Bacteroidetes bacterium]|nr:4-hydroxythreonine-4-phosphate dehydrogenase PdxA [Bacteroidota bacterium]